MNQLVKFGLILALICLVATLVLALTYEVTKPKIGEQRALEEKKEALEVILPGADSFNEKKINDIEYFEALRGKDLIGYCVRVTGSGYGGYIRMIVGIGLSGKIEGVEVLEHYETPGLGAKIEEVKPGEKDAWFLRQFKGKMATEVMVKENVDAITGATISSRAVTDAVRENVAKFLEEVRK